MINGKVLAFNKSLKSETTKSIFYSLFSSPGVWPTDVYPINDIDFELFLSSLSSLPLCKGGPWLSLSEYCKSHLCSARAIRVQLFVFWSKCYLPPELAVQKDHYTDRYLGFTFHLSSHEILNTLCFHTRLLLLLRFSDHGKGSSNFYVYYSLIKIIFPF